ncbi:MAG TPA: 2-isopropylmalate synthase [Kofleriaceae bacterium]|jgi:2-isopropylmalate synthase|nr:2-isopropylmalate synthase [Kofleriaceae bacterium]
MTTTRRIQILDTSLRDGEQAPGASMNSSEKLEVARALARLGVDVIEAGFPAASPDDHAAVATIAAEVGRTALGGRPSDEPPVIQALARAHEGDIDAAWSAIRGAAYPRIHTFLATSDLHLEHKLRMSRDEVLVKVGRMVGHARKLCERVEFSPEDAGRSDPAFLYQVLAVAIEAGATVLNIPDTVGYTMPDEFGALIAGIIANVPGAREVTISVHCHDDLGLAVANSLAGLRNGAGQAEVTVNGIGERAGNASLEELVMLLRTREPVLGLTTGIDSTQLTAVSRVISRATSFPVPPNKAVVGGNAFAHESGIHQDGVLKHQRTYEIMKPEDVGAQQSKLVLGKHSGKHAFGERLAALGVPLEGEALVRAFGRFKQIADRKRAVHDADLLALAAGERAAAPELFVLEDLQVACGTAGLATATVRLRDPAGVVRVQAAVGTGPVDATYKAIDAIVRAPVELLEFTVNAVTEGIDALGEVSVRVQEGEERATHGHGADTDIVVASAKAYLAALNHVVARRPVATLPDPALVAGGPAAKGPVQRAGDAA